ncbi:MAG: hypothetical protein MUC59_12040 [Saprospiraceae bacterium]|nr:hypothetical protein [Saprospiraceae bacterium]
MGNISVQVIDEKNYQMVLSVLKVFADNNIIRILQDEDEASIALPGAPLTDEAWLQYFEKAESEPVITGEEMKAFFKYLKVRAKTRTAA